jgi:hypothetical protein
VGLEDCDEPQILEPGDAVIRLAAKGVLVEQQDGFDGGSGASVAGCLVDGREGVVRDDAVHWEHPGAVQVDQAGDGGARGAVALVGSDEPDPASRQVGRVNR